MFDYILKQTLNKCNPNPKFQLGLSHHLRILNLTFLSAVSPIIEE